MASRRRMEDSERWRAVGSIEAGQSITDVALYFGVHHSVISRLGKQFLTSQTVVRRPVAGRSRITIPAEDRYIAVVAKRNRRSTSTRVTFMVAAAIGKTISATTVRRRLHVNGLYALVPRVCVPLSVQSRGARLKWCRQHVNWTVSDWGNVMFTDESIYALQPDDKGVRVWREQGTRIQPEHITEHHAFRGGSIMVCVGISLGYRTDLHIYRRGSVTAVRYRDEVLDPIVKLCAAAVGPSFVLMDDSARLHRAAIVDDFLESEGIARMEWPAYSPDLNPIENIWDTLGHAVCRRFPPPATLRDLETALEEEWRLLDSAVVDHLVTSMITRCTLCTKVTGAHIPY
ncbi:Transposable element Tcb1 transposase [Araneus ventricosus]|uniref:Transposable element Tcb1 transposase n=1 Tax=Araneus ventricosus TaxID=182803 RepID=A0A4Y2D3T7_ARAVE|nr:Transposable element Tcb1 transposase [Araneus ventricosus]